MSLLRGECLSFISSPEHYMEISHNIKNILPCFILLLPASLSALLAVSFKSCEVAPACWRYSQTINFVCCEGPLSLLSALHVQYLLQLFSDSFNFCPKVEANWSVQWVLFYTLWLFYWKKWPKLNAVIVQKPACSSRVTSKTKEGVCLSCLTNSWWHCRIESSHVVPAAQTRRRAPLCLCVLVSALSTLYLSSRLVRINK